MYERNPSRHIVLALVAILALSLAIKEMPEPVQQAPEPVGWTPPDEQWRPAKPLPPPMPPEPQGFQEERPLDSLSLLVRTDNTGSVNLTGYSDDSGGARVEAAADLGSTFSVRADGWLPSQAQLGVLELDCSSGADGLRYSLNASLPGEGKDADGVLDASTTSSSVAAKGTISVATRPGEVPPLTLVVHAKERKATVSIDSADLPPKDQLAFALGTANQQFAQQGIPTRIEDHKVGEGHVEVTLTDWQALFTSSPDIARELTPQQRARLSSALSKLSLDLTLSTASRGSRTEISLDLDARGLSPLADLVRDLSEVPSISLLREGRGHLSVSSRGGVVDVIASGSMEPLGLDAEAISSALRAQCLRDCEAEQRGQAVDAAQPVPSVIGGLVAGAECAVQCGLAADVVSSALRLDVGSLALSVRAQGQGHSFSLSASGSGMDRLVANITKAGSIGSGSHVPLLRSGRLSLRGGRVEAGAELADVMERAGDRLRIAGDLPASETRISFEGSALASFEGIDASPPPDERRGDSLVWRGRAGQPFSLECRVRVDEAKLKKAYEEARERVGALERMELEAKDAAVAKRTRSVVEEAGRLLERGDPAAALAVLEQAEALLDALPEPPSQGIPPQAAIGIGLVAVVVLAVLFTRRRGGGDEEVVTVRELSVRPAPRERAERAPEPARERPAEPSMKERVREAAKVSPKDEWDTL